MTPVLFLPAAAARFGRVLERRVAGDFELRFSRFDGPADLHLHRHPHPVSALGGSSAARVGPYRCEPTTGRP